MIRPRFNHLALASGALLAGAWLTVVLSAAPAGRPVAQTAKGQPAARDGKALYETACQSCHGPDGRGMPQTTLGFDIAVPDFTDCSFATPEPDADWAAVILHGGPIRAFDRRMPAFTGALSEEDVRLILGYVRGMCADAAWPPGELNLPRPLRTEKAFPENEAVLTTSFDTTGENRISNVFLYERRIGSRSQWEVKVPVDVAGHETLGWQRGLGDVSFGFKRVLAHSGARGSIVSAGGEVIFPTGKEDRGLGRGTTVFEPFVVYGQILPRDSFVQTHAALELAADTAHASHEALWRVAAGRTFTQNGGVGRAWSPMLEVLAVRELESGAPVKWDLVPQMQVTVNTRQHIMLNGGVQFPLNERRGRGTRVMFYLLWDWWDGGLFDGW
ncbi:MAG: cytochrome c [Vicinamibacterales bacterium]